MKVSVGCFVLFLVFSIPGTGSITADTTRQLYSQLERLLAELEALRAHTAEHSAREVQGKPASHVKTAGGNTMIRGLFRADVNDLPNGTVVKSVKALRSIPVPCLGNVPVSPVAGDAMARPASIAVTASANGTRSVNVTFPYRWTLDPATEEGRCDTSVTFVPSACGAVASPRRSLAVNGTNSLTVAWDVLDDVLAGDTPLSFYILVDCKFYSSHGP